MKNEIELKIAVFPGDGIGIEVMDSALAALEAVQAKVGGFRLATRKLEAGAACYKARGTALPDESLKAAEEADAILLGACGLPDVRYPDGTEIAPQVDLRFHFNLYAGVRPIKVLPGGPCALAHPRAREIDFVLIRESTEGLFASKGKGEVVGDELARDTQVITRATSEKLFDFAFRLAAKRKAQGRPGKVTLIDKANVFRSFAFFRKVFDERAAKHPEIATERLYVDACALDFVRRPWDFDVAVTENMFGDILSDLCAGLVGGMGMAPSADIGERHAVFQPCHGSAPDIAGTGKANPTATFLSGAMMLDWLGRKHGNSDCRNAGELIERAVERAYQTGKLRPFELGGSDGTESITAAVMAPLQQLR